MTDRRSHTPLMRLALISSVALGLTPALAHAQAIERNLPPAPAAVSPTIAPPNALPSDQDATPIGPALSAIVTLGAADQPIAASSASVAVGGIDTARTPRLRGEAKNLGRYLGRPLSKKLIAEVEAEIARRYRAAGFPFVSISTPAQEITSGVLQIRVVEFHLAAKTAPGASAFDAPYIESRVRAAPGDPIDTDLLAQDLDWLNRFPFRRTEAVFSPGQGLGATNLQLQTTELKPWSVYAGYANSGSPLTGWDRYFAGGQAVLPWLHDAYAAYQFTGSNDVLFDEDRPFFSAADPAYVSHAGRLYLPTLARQAIEASVSYVQSNEPIQDFLVRQTTYEATLDYRSALSDFWRPLPGEAALGVEVKRQTSRTVFGGADVLGASFDVFQITLAYADQESDRFGKTSGEITAHISPGGVNDRNTDAAFSTFSKGRASEADYVYISGVFNRFTKLPALLGVQGFALTDSLIGQYAAQPLPLTEQIGLGNNNLVRGYTLDDGAFDAGLVSRNELRTPAFPLLGRATAIPDQLSPYVFLDAGYGKDQRTKADAAPISTGLGADYQLGAHLAASVDGAWALRSVGFTKSGDARLETRVTLSF